MTEPTYDRDRVLAYYMSDNRRVFDALTAMWKNCPSVSVWGGWEKVWEHPAYHAICGMGELAVSLILENWELDGGWWANALERITKQNPVPPEDRENYHKSREAWLDWGKANGYMDFKSRRWGRQDGKG